MEGNTTIIWDVNDEEKTRRKFAFDYSYWSHSGFHADSTGLLIPDDDKYACFDIAHSQKYLSMMYSRYADQKKVFNDLGVGVLKNAFEGVLM